MHSNHMLNVFMENNIELHFKFFLSRKLNPLELVHTDVYYTKDRSLGVLFILLFLLITLLKKFDVLF